MMDQGLVNELALLDLSALVEETPGSSRFGPATRSDGATRRHRRSSNAEAGQAVSHAVVQVGRLIIVLAAAGIVCVAVALASALIGHELLVRIYGENLAHIDDTLPMILAVWTAYLAGGLSAVAVVALGWRQFVRRR